MSCGNCVNCSNKCDVCLDCDGNKSPHSSLNKCNTAQTYCNGSRMYGQNVSAYGGTAAAPTINDDDPIIKVMDRATFNRLIKYVEAATQHKDWYSGAYWFDGEPADSIAGSQAIIAEETKDHVYTAKVNELLDAMRGLYAGNNPGPNKADEDVIYAEFFRNIMDKINNLQIHPSSCHSCVTSCDTTCNTCNTCNSCISCNSCQAVSSYSSHYSSHYSSG